ncbi:MAG TPA: ATP-dependent zinc metalloprotease FtsH [Bradyrhizobium sp.]|nr:ATP-dependent zinc metalloprotease FtsH [Stellaceae bacterium]HUN97955.1 ATP-dependent zinc metalloprotease FtsH [Bradyrhizobium sp.]
MKRVPPIVFVCGGLFLALIAFSFWLGSSTGPQRVSYSVFEKDLADGQIKSATVTGDDIQATLKDGSVIVTTRVANDLATQFAEHGVEVTGYPQASSGFGWLLWLPMLMLLPFLFMRGGAGGAMGPIGAITQSKAKVFAETETKVTFGDVAGVDEAKEELKEIVAFLKDPKAYGRLGAHIPKGVLLVGPPGTGKTLLARAVAGEAGVPFLSINGSEFVELYVGVGAARVRDLFAQGREKAPAIIFIDELDALGHARGGPSHFGGNDEKEQTLNQLLSEMDGFDPSVGLVLLAATNRPEILDPALLRAGRFDRQVLVDRPDKTGRIQILNIYLKKICLARGVSAEEIAALTPGFTGADLATLVNEAALLATRRNSENVTAADFTGAIERIIAGLEKKNRILSPKEREIVAHHEMGHALVASVLPGSDPVQKISIIPRGIGALGYTIQRPIEDRFLMTEDELQNKMAVLLGGRAAERLIFGKVSTGAADDLAKATDIARSAAAQYGMVPTLGDVAYDRVHQQFLPGQQQPGGWFDRSYAEQTAREIDCAVREMVSRAAERALAELEKRREVLVRGAKLLLEKETLSAADLKRLLNGRKTKLTTASTSVPDCADAA